MKNNFVILITASPQNTQAHLTAINYISSLIERKESVSCVFFYQDAVLVANQFNQPPSDEVQLLDEWELLAKRADLELMTCVAASFRRGVVDKSESENRELSNYNLSDTFSIAGLGQLSAALVAENAKLVHFK